MTKAKLLGKHLGGIWTYDGCTSWHCDDGRRSVRRCSPGVDQFDDPLPGCAYWLYGDGAPQPAEPFLHENGPVLFL